MKVLLVTKATGDNYSVEAGLADDVMHFDHHGEWSSFPAPSNNSKIPKLKPDDVVEITHLDADTLLALFRMAGVPLPKLDYDLIEQADLHGSSVVKDKSDPSYLFTRGVFLVSKEVGFPRVSKEPQDVTDKINKMLSTPTEKYIRLGREQQDASEATFKNKLVDKSGKVGLWVISKDDAYDPSRPYADGYACVVVYRSTFKSISIYCAPDNPYKFGNQTVAGIPFAGHDKACGSPRGEEITLDDAKRVFKAVAEKVNRLERTATYISYRGALYVRDV